MKHLSLFIVSLFAVASAPAVPLGAQTRAAELPRAVPSVAMPAPARVLRVSASGNLQAALNSARPGDAIELPCGTTYTGTFIWPNKGPAAAWTVLRPSCYAQLPPPGTRIDTAIARRLRLPKLVSADAGYAIATAVGAHHLRIIGIEVTAGTTFGKQSYGLVGLGTHQGQAAPGAVAHHLVLDRVYVHGTPTLSLRRCVALNSAETAIVDSWLSECHDIGSDAQAIGGWNGPGPYLIENNRLEGSTETIMFGGSDAEAARLSPADITIRRNYIRKPPEWRKGPWQIKALLELKDARRVLIEGNVLEGNWAQAWPSGVAFALKSMNQDCRAPWAQTADVTIRRNLVRKVGAAFDLAAMQGCEPVVPMARVLVQHNVVLGLRSPEYQGSGTAFVMAGTLSDIAIDHNTVTWVGWGVAVNIVDSRYGSTRASVTNNLFATVGGVSLQGEALGYPGPSVAKFLPGGTVAGNVWAVGGEYACCTEPDRNWRTFPSGNRMVVNADTLFRAIGFENGATGDVRLSQTSPFKGAATGGADPGADVAAVLAATAGVVEGRPPAP